MHEPFGTRILVEPGKTREPTKKEERQIKRMQTLLEDACEAEELFELDELERFAEGKD